MADASAQVRVHEWVAKVWLSNRLNQPFERGRVRLTSGGEHSFAAVSEDRQTIASIHTSGATTATGKLAVGKLTKVRADLFFLLLARAETKYSIFTDSGMYALVSREREAGRMPSEVQFLLVEELPPDLRNALLASQSEASGEMLG